MESNKIKEQLLSALKTGFIDESHLSNPEYVPEILINDQSRNKKVLSTIQRELSECDNFIISAAFLTMSGFASLSNKLYELREKGVKGKILVSQYLNFTEPEALKRLLDFDNISSKIVTEDDFHSKGFLFKKEAKVDRRTRLPPNTIQIYPLLSSNSITLLSQLSSAEH